MTRKRQRNARGDEITCDYGSDYFDLFIAPVCCRCAACAATRRKRRRSRKAANVTTDGCPVPRLILP